MNLLNLYKHRVLVCGGRKFIDGVNLMVSMDALHAEQPIDLLIEGGAPGADRLAGNWADGHGIDHLRVPAQWEKLGRRAGPARNKRMLMVAPNLVVAFPGGAGTADMVAQAKRASIKVKEID